jgi:hypothetical protein
VTTDRWFVGLVSVGKDLCALELKLAGRESTVAGATPKTATGTGALPSNVPVDGRAQAPANGSLGWTNENKAFCKNWLKPFSDCLLLC